MFARINLPAYIVTALASTVTLVGCSDAQPTALDATSLRRATESLDTVAYRPIEEFLSAQGTEDARDSRSGVASGFIGWKDARTGITAASDYAGVAYRRQTDVTASAGHRAPGAGAPTISAPVFFGQIVESRLPYGRARVIVMLETRNALSYAIRSVEPMGDSPPFSASSYESISATRGNSRLTLIYTTDREGRPMPDLLRLIEAPQPGITVERLDFESVIRGPVDTSSLQVAPTLMIYRVGRNESLVPGPTGIVSATYVDVL